VESSIGPYSIQRLINQGGQGQVYLGYDRRLQRQVAIKIHPLPASRRARRRVLQEAQRVAGIHSPRVVQIYDVVQSSDYLAMVMEYVPGCDLEDFLSAASPSLASVLTVASDLAVALAASRQQGLVHGDIKAANVLVTPQGRVKLTDFGIARAAGEPGNKMSAGSLSAVAPEQLSGQVLDIRTDLFSLGRLLYRMLTGEHSYARAGVPDPLLLQGVESVKVPPLLLDGSEVPNELRSLVDQLLCLDPEQRPRNTHQVRRILRDVTRSLPLSSADSLLQEAGPLFRQESPADIPPQIPDQLRQRGRSSNTQGTLKRWNWTGLPRSPMAAVLGLLLLVVAIPLVAAWRGQVNRVHIQEPQVELLAGAAPPLSHRALAAAVRDVIAEENPAARFSGAVPDRAIYSSVGDRGPDEDIAIQLRCDALACLLLLRRQLGGDSHYQQVLLARQQSESYWIQQLQQATAALYR
jgi:eukaryotic-like serine/threonine-protein kinase